MHNLDKRIQDQWKIRKAAFVFLRRSGSEGSEVDPGALNSQVLSSSSLLFHFLSKPGHGPPIDPLLDQIRTRYQGLSPQDHEKFWETIPVYEAHKSFLRPWFDNGEVQRWDDLFRASGELDWEQHRFFATLEKMIAALWPDKPPVFLWDGFDQAGCTIGAWLLWLMKESQSFNGAVICIFREEKPLLVDWEDDFRRSFLQHIETKSLIEYEIQNLPLRPHFELTRGGDPDEVLRWLKEARVFFASKEALRYESTAPRGWDRQGTEADFYLGLLYFFQDDYNKAGLLLQTAFEKSRKLGDPQFTARILFHLALANFRKKDRSQAGKFLNLCEKAVEEVGDQELQVFIRSAKLFLNESLWETPESHLQWIEFVRGLEGSKYHPLVEMLKSILSYFRGLVKVQGVDHALKEAKEAFDYHLSQDHTYHTARLAHILGYLSQEIAPERALEYYRMSIGMRLDLGDPLELIKVYNGVGYFCFTIGENKEAMGYFEKSLSLLEARKDFTETCLTLFNISNLFFFSGHFESTLETLEKILVVMKSLQMPSLPWHSRIKLHSFAGLAAFYAGRKTRALDYWGLVCDGTPDQEAYPAYALLQSLIQSLTLKDNTWYEDLQKACRVALDVNQVYFGAFILMEIGSHWRTLENQAESRRAFAQARELLQQRNMGELILVLDKLEKSGIWGQVEEAHFFDNPIRLITRNLSQSAEQEASSFALLRKVNELTFIKDFQSAIHRDLPERSLFKKTVELIRHAFILRRFQIAEGLGKSAVVLGSFPRTGNKGILQPWESLWFDERTAKVKSLQTEGTYQWAYPFRSQKGRYLWFWAEADLNPGVVEDFEVLSLALKHLEMTLELRRAVESIQDLLTNDALTRTLNRGEFFRRAETERIRCLRYHQDRSQVFTLVFLDLDNFKYYNDTFGHGVGDKVLKAFADLVKSHIREMDSLGRWGGDEFVMLLPETDVPGAKVLSWRILESLKKVEGFQDLIAAEIGKTPQIPEDMVLSCSFGVEAFDAGAKLTVAEVLDRADKKLYEAKKAGKARVV